MTTKNRPEIQAEADRLLDAEIAASRTALEAEQMAPETGEPRSDDSWFELFGGSRRAYWALRRALNESGLPPEVRYKVLNDAMAICQREGNDRANIADAPVEPRVWCHASCCSGETELTDLSREERAPHEERWREDGGLDFAEGMLGEFPG